MKLASRFLVTVLAFLMLFSFFGCQKGSDVPLSAGLSMIEGEPIYDKDVAMQTDHFTVTPGMMAYFFYDYGGEVLVAMEQTKPFDASRSLHDQIYEGDLSFYDVIMNATLKKVSELLIYCEAAHKAGVSLTEAQKKAIDQEMQTLTMTAAIDSQTADVYLQARYGPLMSKEAFRGVLELELLASTYSVTVNRQLESSITAEGIKDYAKANGLNDKTPSRNMAYLVIPYVGGKADEEAVNAVLAALKNAPTSATLEGFADEYTVGEEKNLTPDNVGVKTIGDWLFDSGRKQADYGRAEGNNCTYVIVYTDNGMSYGEVSARMYLYDAAYAAWYNGMVEELHFGYNYDVIDGYDLG